MKLISSFRDYYDSISHQYLDKEILFIRDQKTVSFSRKEADKFPTVTYSGIRNPVGVNNSTVDLGMRAEIIGFCGKLYPVIVVEKKLQENQPRKIISAIYTLSDFEQFVETEELSIAKRAFRWTWADGYDFGYLSEVKEFFESRTNNQNLESKFLELNVPYFVYRQRGVGSRDYQIVTNPILKDYRFVSVKDPFTAHQEIYQFVSGFLKQPQNEMVNISDKDKIHKHGFDKWSFRKPPGEKK